MQFIVRKEPLAGVEEAGKHGVENRNSAGQRSYFKRLGRSMWKGKKELQIDVDALSGQEREPSETAAFIVKAMMQGGYAFAGAGLSLLKKESLFSCRDALAAYPEGTVSFISQAPLEASIAEASVQGRCAGYARMTGDLPGNYFRTEDFLAYAEDLASALSVSCQCFGDQALKEMNCGGILAVNQASEREAGMAVLSYEGAKGKPYTALVGKGILFDSGGYHLKSMEAMEGMKYDMCGAADVLAVFECMVRRKAKINLLAVLPAAENVISPEGVKMGDVLTTMSGKTVEVYNTDAEGRLLLSDALTYACLHAETVIDLATLTYSCKNALGAETAGVFSNDETLCRLLSRSAQKTGEKVWRLPLDESFHEAVRSSKTADLVNYAPGMGAGASVAACFLEEFIKDGVAWAHIDMVGPAVLEKDSEESEAGATGAMIDTTAACLEELAKIE